MTTQVANVSRLYGSIVEVHLVATSGPIERVKGKITGVDSVGVSIVETPEDADDVSSSAPHEQFFPWTSIGRIVVP